MKKEDIFTLNHKELEENSKISSLEIARKIRVPVEIVEMLKIKIRKEEDI